MTTQIQRIAGEIAGLLAFHDRMDEALIKGDDDAPPLMDNAMKAATVRREALESFIETREPETLIDGFILAIRARVRLSELLDNGYGLSPEIEANLKGLCQVQCAVIRCLERHSGATVAGLGLTEYLLAEDFKPWPVIAAEAEERASKAVATPQKARVAKCDLSRIHINVGAP